MSFFRSTVPAVSHSFRRALCQITIRTLAESSANLFFCRTQIEAEIGRTGQWSLFRIKHASGQHRFVGRWDEAASALDIDFEGLGNAARSDFKCSRRTSSGHHTDRLKCEGWHFFVSIVHAGRQIFKGTVDFSLQREAEINLSVVNGLSCEAEVVPAPIGINRSRKIVMTRSQIVQNLAETCLITRKLSEGLLAALAETAIRELKERGVFVIPGIGRLIRVDRKGRIGRNPGSGQAIRIPATKAVKFRVARAAMDAFVPPQANK